MIKIDFYDDPSKDKEKIVFKFYEMLKERRRDSCWSKLDAWCGKYLPKTKDGKDCTFEMVVTASPEKLLEYKQYLDENQTVNAIMKELPHSSQNAQNSKHLNYYTYTLYNSISRGESYEDVKYFLLKELGVTVCPYCNRNYINSDEKVTSCELDHYIPKGKYPIFAVSFYNLIPVCSSCNKKKNDEEFRFYPHKMEKATDELLRFEYEILGMDYLKDRENLRLRIETSDADYDKQIDILKLRELYSFHTDILQDILRKNEAFSDTYLKSVYDRFNTIFSSPDEIKELLYGAPLKSENYADRPLAKMTADIVRELTLLKKTD